MNEQTVFTAAIERDPAERPAFLDEACGTDQQLRVRVERLIELHENAGSFLERPAAGAGPTVELLVEQLGMQVGPYKLLQPIGEGGMGVVYMAEQLEPVRRRVALKVIKPGMDSRQVIARFEAERQALAMMDHVNIARVFDAGTTEAGRPYFVMELVHGVPITQYCDDNHLTPRRRLELFVPVCQAIQHAHQKGIIHRDIKPSNVMVTLYDGQPVPKVIDFGVAKATAQRLTERTLFTQYGTLVGTLEYMSPEQAEMNALGVDTRSDIYSLGVLLYELLTGSTPLSRKQMLEAAFAEILRLIKEEEPPKPSTRLSESGEALASISAQRHTEPAKLSKQMRGELDWIVMKTLEKDRNRRYETASGFAAEVQRYLNDEPVQACPPSAWYRFRKFARRNKAALATVAVVAVALLLGTLGTTWQAIRATRERDRVVAAEGLAESRLEAETQARKQAKASYEEASTQKKRAEESAREADQQRRIAVENENTARQQEGIARQSEQMAKDQEMLARRRFYAAQMNLAHQAWQAGNRPRVLELLEGQRPRFDEQDLRGFEWYYFWRSCQQGHRFTLRGARHLGDSVVYSPDGRLLATAGMDNTVRLWDAATGQLRSTLVGYRRGWKRIAFSPDGKLLAHGGGPNRDAVTLFDTGTGQVQRVLPTRGSVRYQAFSPDGKTLATGSEATTEVVLWDTSTWHVRTKLEGCGGITIRWFAFSPDGRALATSTGWEHKGGRVLVWDLSSEPFKPKFELPVSDCVEFSPDGLTVATRHSVRGVELWDAVTGDKREAVSQSVPQGHGLAFSPDGKCLAFGASARGLILWRAGADEEQSYAHLSGIHCVAFSPDGESLASASEDRTVKVWAVNPKPVVESFQHAGVLSTALSSDGHLLAVGGSEGTIKLWNAETGEEIASLDGGFAAASHGEVAFSPDSRLLASAHGVWDVTSPGNVKLWDTATGLELVRLEGHIQPLCVAFSPDGKTLASGGQDDTVRLWSVETYAELRWIDTGSGFTTAVAFSPDGRLLAAAGYHGHIKLWDVATGRQCLAMQEAGVLYGVFGLAFSPDGQTLAVGLPDGTIKLRDPQSGRLRRSLKGDTAYIVSLAYFPDGRTLASGSGSGMVKLWDLATGQELMTLSEGAHIAITADGNMLAAAHGDKVVVHRAATDTEAIVYRSELDPDDVDSPVAQNAAADMLLSAEQLQEAEALCRQAAARLEKLAAHFPDTPDYRAQLARSHLGLGLIKHWRKEVQSSAEHYRRALKELETVAAAWPGVLEHHEDVARALFALSDRLAAAGPLTEAIEACRQGLSIQAIVVARTPHAQTWFDLASRQLTLAAMLDRQHQPDLAQQERRNAALSLSKVIQLEALYGNAAQLRETALRQVAHAESSTRAPPEAAQPNRESSGKSD